MSRETYGLMPENRRYVQYGLTALAGGGASGATPLDADAYNIVDTVATLNDSCILPAGKRGMLCFVSNKGAQNMAVFPASGENAGGGVDTAVTVNSGANATFFCNADGVWEEI